MLLATLIFYGLLTFVLVMEARVVVRLVARRKLPPLVAIMLVVIGLVAAVLAVRAGVAVVSMLCIAALAVPIGTAIVVLALKRVEGGGGVSRMQRAQRAFEESSARWREAHQRSFFDEAHRRRYDEDYQRRYSLTYSHLSNNVWHRAP